MLVTHRQEIEPDSKKLDNPLSTEVAIKALLENHDKGKTYSVRRCCLPQGQKDPPGKIIFILMSTIQSYM